MNWKELCLIASLILTAGLTSCAGTDANNNQVSPSTAPAADSSSPGDAMKKGDAMQKDGDAMKKGESMQKESEAPKPQ